MAVRGVLAEADVGDHGQLGVGLLQRPHRHLHDALVVVGRRSRSRPCRRGRRRAGSRRRPRRRSRSPRRPARRSRSARCPASSRPPRGRPRRRRRRRAGSGAPGGARSRGPGRAGSRCGACGACGWRGTAWGGRVYGRASSVLRVQARGLVKRYGEREALKGVDFAAEPGELVAVIGPNGAGKTTLLSILAGTLRPDAGSVESPERGRGLGAAAGGAVPAADGGGEPAAVRAAREAGGAARGGRGDAGADRPAGAAGGGRGQALGRQPAAGQHRDRVAGAARCAAAWTSRASGWTRASGRGCGSSSSASPGGGRAVVFSTHDIQEAERYGSGCSSSPTASASSTARRASCARRCAARRPRRRGGDFETAFVAYLQHRGH